MGDVHTSVNDHTVGNYQTEDEAMQDLDRRVAASKLFRASLSEVTGEFVHPRIGTGSGQCRIDRILLPAGRLLDGGWAHGPIGIEGKKSGLKVGKVIAQAADHSRVSYPVRTGFHVILEWIFIWPLSDVRGDADSIMSQLRVGWAHPWRGDGFVFGVSSTSCLKWSSTDGLTIRNLTCGQKRGHR